MSIKTELTHSEFITLYGETEYVRGYSDEAKLAILEHITDNQDEEGYDLDWTPYFMNAGEFEPSDILDDHNNFGVDDMADELVELADDFEFTPEIEEELENSELDSEALWAKLKEQLLSNTDFAQEASELVAENQNLFQIKNGNWIKFDQ